MRSSALLLSGLICLQLAVGAGAAPARAERTIAFCGTPPPDWPHRRPTPQQPLDMACHMALRPEEEAEE